MGAADQLQVGPVQPPSGQISASADALKTEIDESLARWDEIYRRRHTLGSP
jgi:hypothetical protein